MQDMTVSDDAMIGLAQTVRRDIINEFTKDGIPTDKDQLNVLLRAAEGAASTAVSNKKVKAEADTTNAIEQGKAILLTLFQNGAIGKDPFKKEDSPGIERVLPDTLLDGVETVPGETDVGLASETFDTFAEKHGL